MENIVQVNEFNEYSKEEKDEYIASVSRAFAPKLSKLEYVDGSEMFTHPEPENWEDSDIEPDTSQMEWVDLGLPSGTLWGKYNIGASSEEDAGLYFAWGETCGYTQTQTTERNFSYDDYKFADYDECDGYSKYNSCDDKFILDDEDNAAKILLGEDCDIPDYPHIQELLNNTSTTCIFDDNDNPKGILFSSNYYDDDNHKLFIPFSGIKVNGQAYFNINGFSFSCKYLGYNLSYFYGGEGGIHSNNSRVDRYACMPIRPIIPGLFPKPIFN